MRALRLPCNVQRIDTANGQSGHQINYGDLAAPAHAVLSKESLQEITMLGHCDRAGLLVLQNPGETLACVAALLRLVKGAVAYVSDLLRIVHWLAIFSSLQGCHGTYHLFNRDCA